MNLVPTLDRVVSQIVAEDFWANHFAGQQSLGEQCADSTDHDTRMCMRVGKIKLPEGFGK